MGKKTLAELERELSHSYTESLRINKDPNSPHMKEAISMLLNRALSTSLRKSILN